MTTMEYRVNKEYRKKEIDKKASLDTLCTQLNAQGLNAAVNKSRWSVPIVKAGAKGFEIMAYFNDYLLPWSSVFFTGTVKFDQYSQEDAQRAFNLIASYVPVQTNRQK